MNHETESDKFKLKKFGSAHTTFYEHKELPGMLQKVLESSLAIKDIHFIPQTGNDQKPQESP